MAPEAAATEELYERYGAQVLRFCRHQLGSLEEAEDAAQTTFMNAFRGLSRGIEPESESAWLFAIAQNVCLTRRRSSWRRGRVESPNDLDLIQEVVPALDGAEKDELFRLQESLAEMPDVQRRAILLREWQGLSYREIAEELELTQSAVETLIFRARRSLARNLEQAPLPPAERRALWQRARKLLDLGSALAAAKALLAGATAVKAAATTAAAVTVVAAVASDREHVPRQPPLSAPVAAQVAAPPLAVAMPERSTVRATAAPRAVVPSARRAPVVAVPIRHLTAAAPARSVRAPGKPAWAASPKPAKAKPAHAAAPARKAKAVPRATPPGQLRKAAVAAPAPKRARPQLAAKPRPTVRVRQPRATAWFNRVPQPAPQVPGNGHANGHGPARPDSPGKPGKDKHGL